MSARRYLACLAIVAATVIPACAHEIEQSSVRAGAGHPETITPLYKGALPNVPGKSLIAVEVTFPPGAASPPHTHPKSAFLYAYVLSGEIESAVDGTPTRIFRAGDSWHEEPDAHHRLTRNISKAKMAKLLVVFIADSSTDKLVLPDAEYMQGTPLATP